uniref:Uncharacterized protein n=1 Tax=Mucochytrium quahogii TaxID=96639 RepID=A0A7S2WEC0_9STRA|mmetsp:Transcript_19982/g.32953  ORF Transcript_19982/g.32953 Transcript_19982/m.32953 type:complete len:626 (+) Transcript_19982:355-2232(+)
MFQRIHAQSIPFAEDTDTERQTRLDQLALAILNGDLQQVDLLLETSTKDIELFDFVSAIDVALQNNHKEIVQRLVENKNVSFDHLLRRTCFAGKLDVLKELLEYPESDSTNGVNPLLASANYNQPEIVIYLLEEGRYDIKFSELHTLMLWAAKRGHTQVVKLLLADQSLDTQKLSSNAFLSAARNGHVEILRLLVANASTNPLPHMRTENAFMAACEQGRLEVVEVLVSPTGANVDPSCRQNGGLKLACISKNTQLVKFLLDDPRVDPASQNQAALSSALTSRDIDMVELLLEDGRSNLSKLDPGVITNCTKFAPLRLVKMIFGAKHDIPIDTVELAYVEACKAGAMETVKCIVSQTNINPACKDHLGFSNACISGNLGLVQYLLGFPQIQPQTNRSSAIISAASLGHIDIVKLLLEDGRSDPSDKENFAICLASEEGRHQLVKLLLSHPNVDPSAHDNFAIESAVNGNGAETVAALLESEKVDPSAKNNACIRACLKKKLSPEILEMLLRHPKVDPTVILDRRVLITVEPVHLALLARSPKVRAILQDKRFAFERAIIKRVHSRLVSTTLSKAANIVPMLDSLRQTLNSDIATEIIIALACADSLVIDIGNNNFERARNLLYKL